jgi:hypothetical protein
MTNGRRPDIVDSDKSIDVPRQQLDHETDAPNAGTSKRTRRSQSPRRGPSAPEQGQGLRKSEAHSADRRARLSFAFCPNWSRGAPAPYGRIDPAASSGIRNVNLVSASEESTSIEPPCALAISHAM